MTDMIADDNSASGVRIGNLRPASVDMMPYTPGMSLRDWFAGQALNGVISAWSEEDNKRMAAARMSKPQIMGLLANDAYALADAMLAARKGGGA